MELSRRQRAVKSGCLPLLCLALLAAGCQRQKQTDTGKTYTSNAPAQPGGGGGSSGGSAKSGDAQPLDAPADTTNGKVSRASDVGDSSATKGQVVAEPGAPVEHQPPPPDSRKTPAGH